MHTSFFRVRQYECDAYGHLNNVNYVRYLQEAIVEAGAAAGLLPGAVRHGGVAVADATAGHRIPSTGPLRRHGGTAGFRARRRG